VSGWIPVEYGAQVIQKVTQRSAVETYAQAVMMASNSRYVARDGGVVAGLVQKGSAYGPFGGAQAGTSDNTDDSVLITAGKWGTEIDIAEEDIMDSLADIINSKSSAIGTALAKVYDNVSLGVNAAAGATNAQTTSVYRAMTQADAATGYTANANVVASGAGSRGIPSYDNLNNALGFVEQGDYFNEEDMLVIAHPFYRQAMRGIKDTQGRPIFIESSGGFPGGGQGGTPDLLFRIPIFWSLGAVVTTAPTSALPANTYSTTSGSAPAGTAGNRLLVFANRLYLLAGKRTTNPTNPGATPEFQIVPPMYSGTDTTVLRGRMRRGFSVGTEFALALVEGTQ
jgi:HK97 family phage major capsid protein